MLRIATVNWRNYAGRGAEYVEKLYAGVRRHLDSEWKGVCLTDNFADVPDGVEPRSLPKYLHGYFNKIALFQPGMFDEGDRVLYIDLDTVILGDLTDIAGYRGRFAGLKDPLGTPLFASGVMAWEAGEADDIWNEWVRWGKPELPRGDQEWIGRVRPDADRLQDLFPDQLVSFKVDCWPLGRPPNGARVCFFHGQPRPHQCTEPWIKQAWTA